MSECKPLPPELCEPQVRSDLTRYWWQIAYLSSWDLVERRIATCADCAVCAWRPEEPYDMCPGHIAEFAGFIAVHMEQYRRGWLAEVAAASTVQGLMARLRRANHRAARHEPAIGAFEASQHRAWADARRAQVEADAELGMF
jgi:hypothetical protein